MTSKKTKSATANKKASAPNKADQSKPAARGAAPEVAGENAKAQQERDDRPKKLGALDAAARVLAESPDPMSTKQMIESMSSKGYWTSPGGKTPHATLYSAILRELAAKGPESRFVKTERGKFTARK